MSGYLLDTNVLSELRKGSRANPQVLSWFETVEESELFISVLALGEIRAGIERVRSNDLIQARTLERWLDRLATTYADRIIPISAAVADRWGRLSANDRPPVVDGLMAATALENNLVLVTRNTDDVARTGIGTIDPFQASR
jgi:predicted nucleic acid-binding protein